MGLRFRRSIRLFPGLRLNLSKRGVSASIGVRGAHVTSGPTGTRTTVGLLGTGVSYTTTSEAHHEAPGADSRPPAPDAVFRPSAVRGWLWLALIVAVVLAALMLAERAHADSPVPGHEKYCAMIDAQIHKTLDQTATIQAGLIAMAEPDAREAALAGCYSAAPSNLPALLIAVVAACIAGWGARIAQQQRRIAREKLRLDLFERRFKVFDAARGLISVAFTNGAVTESDLWKFRSLTVETRFLFGDDITSVIDSLDKDACTAAAFAAPKGESYGDHAKQNQLTAHAAVGRLIDELNGLYVRFAPYLKFDRNID